MLQVLLVPGSKLVFHTSLLQLRGHAPVKPPHKDARSNILLFNGKYSHEASAHHSSAACDSCSSLVAAYVSYGGLQVPLYLVRLPQCLLDAVTIWYTPRVWRTSSLCQYALTGDVFGELAIPEGCNDGLALLEALGAPGANVAAILSSLRGPWAVVYWQAASQTLWLGRDPIGKPAVSWLMLLSLLVVQGSTFSIWRSLGICCHHITCATFLPC